MFFGASGHARADILSDAAYTVNVFGGSSTTSNQAAADCSGLKIVAVAGVPQNGTHQYAFKGTCLKFFSQRKDGKETGKSEVVTLWAEAKAEWDTQASTFKDSQPKESAGSVFRGSLYSV